MRQMQVTRIDSYVLHRSLFTILITLAQHLFSDFLLVQENASYSQTWLCHHQMHRVRFFWISIQIAPPFLLWPDALTSVWCTGSKLQSTDRPLCIHAAVSLHLALFWAIQLPPGKETPNFLKHPGQPRMKVPMQLITLLMTSLSACFWACRDE